MNREISRGAQLMLSESIFLPGVYGCRLLLTLLELRLLGVGSTARKTLDFEWRCISRTASAMFWGTQSAKNCLHLPGIPVTQAHQSRIAALAVDWQLWVACE